jgi:hypothetical protein
MIMVSSWFRWGFLCWLLVPKNCSFRRVFTRVTPTLHFVVVFLFQMARMAMAEPGVELGIDAAIDGCRFEK